MIATITQSKTTNVESTTEIIFKGSYFRQKCTFHCHPTEYLYTYNFTLIIVTFVPAQKGFVHMAKVIFMQ